MTYELEPPPKARPGDLLKRLLFWDISPWITICGVLLVALSVGVTGFATHIMNNAMQITIVDVLRDPGMYPGDKFAEVVPSYVSMLWELVALLNRYFPIKTLLFSLWLIERALLLWSAGHLARALMPRSALAIIGAMAFFTLGPMPILGHGTIISVEFEQTGMSIPFILLCALAFVKRRYYWCSILLAIACYLNIMYGFFAATYIAAAFLSMPDYRSEWKRWIAPGILCGLLLAPLVILIVRSMGAVEPPDPDLWFKATRSRMYLHLYPLAWTTAEYARFFLYIVVILGVLYRVRASMPRLIRFAVAWVITGMAWLGFAFAAAYAVRVPFLLVMHPARATDIWYCLGGIAACAGWACGFSESKGRNTLLPLLFFVLVALLCPLNLWILIIFVLIAGLEPVWGRAVKSQRTSCIAALVLVMAVASSVFTVKERKELTGNYIVIPIHPTIVQIAEWAQQNTPREALFLVNPTWEQFRSLAKRPVFVTWKDGSTIMWNRGFVEPWAERVGAIGLDIEHLDQYGVYGQDELQNYFFNLTDDRVAELSAEYRISYWVLPNRHATSFPVVFGTPHYKVVELK